MIEPLKLTQKQKEKLLKMCKKLFPHGKARLTSKNNIKIWVLDGSGQCEGENLITIHWFEFCMTHLADKILDDDREYSEGSFPSTLEYFRGSVCYRLNKDAHANEIANYNPVDYLYKEFLKLKDDTKIT